MARTTAVVDGHVHIHACYGLDGFFDHAYGNLNRAANGASDAALYLLMTECAGDDFFGRLRQQQLVPQHWQISATDEPESLIAVHGERRLRVVAGRQVACREGLEVLMLGTTGQFKDRRPIREVLAEATGLGLAHVIPWGAGKWFFARGKLLSGLLREHQTPLFFLGDEGGRPGFWPYPSHFSEGAKLGVRDLPGTDPLPFAHDVEKVGKVGFRTVIDLDERRPAQSLLSVLKGNASPIERFATLEPPVRFVRNQVAMQLRKR